MTTNPTSGKPETPINIVHQEQIWKESVHSEEKAVKDWEMNWSYQLNYDFKGNWKERKIVNLENRPDAKSVFTGKLPKSVNHSYGANTNENLTKMDTLGWMHNRKQKTILSDYWATIY